MLSVIFLVYNVRTMSKKAIAHLRTDPVMAAVIDKIGPVPFKPRLLDPFQSITHAIIHQQLSGKAAATILQRFIALFGDTGFPTPFAVASIDEERLRSAGLSRAKTEYIRSLAQKTREGLVPSLEDCHKSTDSELISQLTSIKGVGRWTVEMLLIFNLGRSDVLPVHDLGIRKGYQRAYNKRNLPKPEQLERIGVKWAPFRTMAALYLWRTADFLKDGNW
jgi:DNA-3-methyladenine glycosylase II